MGAGGRREAVQIRPPLPVVFWVGGEVDNAANLVMPTSTVLMGLTVPSSASMCPLPSALNWDPCAKAQRSGGTARRGGKREGAERSGAERRIHTYP